MEQSRSLQGVWPALLAVAALALTLVLLGRAMDTLPEYWSREALLDVAGWALGYCFLAGMLVWCRPQWAWPALAAGAMLYFLQGLGWAGGLATLLFFTACWCSGHGLLHWLFPQQGSSPQSLALVTGLLLQLALFGLLIHFPVNLQPLYLLLLLLPLVRLRQPAARKALADALRGMLPAAPLPPRRSQLACLLLAGVVLTVARYSLFPTIGFDDNALHLRLWTELEWQQQAGFDFHAQVWVLAPFLLDLLHAVISLAAGSDARGALNLCLLALLLRQLWCVLEQWQVTPTGRWLLLALLASTPLLANLLVTLQVELLLATLAALAVRLLLQPAVSWHEPRSAGLLACAALACGAKLPGAVLGLLLLLPLLPQCRVLQPASWMAASRRQRLLLGGFVLACTFVALHSYGLAWWHTGNPLFPLYNGIFQSPYNDPWNFTDARWQKGFSLASWLGLFFATSAHYESQDFVAGFQYLLLFPLGLLLLWRRLPRTQLLVLALPLLGFGIVMFAATQYLRYLFPVLPLASLALLPYADGARPDWPRLLQRGSLLGCMALNLYFLPGVTWLFDAAPGAAYTATGRASLVERFMPEQILNEALNTSTPGSRVLYDPERPFGARLHGEPWYTMWYAPHRRDLVAAIADTAALRRSLQAEGISHVIRDLGDTARDAGVELLLNAHLAEHGLPLQRADQMVLYALQDDPLPWRRVWQTTGSFGPQQPPVTTPLTLAGARALRLVGEVACRSAAGWLVIELHWDAAAPARQVSACREGAMPLQLVLPVPPGASSLSPALFRNDGDMIDVTALTLELY